MKLYEYQCDFCGLIFYIEKNVPGEPLGCPNGCLTDMEIEKCAYRRFVVEIEAFTTL
jgi:hypothetical protein